MDAKQAKTDSCSQVMEPEVQPTKTSPPWRGAAIGSIVCVGGGGLLIAGFLTWGYWEFGSLSNTFAYLNGERLLADSESLSFGSAHRGEVRDLHLKMQNRTGKEVKILGLKSTCGCMGTQEKFPFAIAAGGQRELTIRVWPTGKDRVFEKRIDFYTNDETKPTIPVLVRGTIVD